MKWKHILAKTIDQDKFYKDQSYKSEKRKVQLSFTNNYRSFRPIRTSQSSSRTNRSSNLKYYFKDSIKSTKKEVRRQLKNLSQYIKRN